MITAFLLFGSLSFAEVKCAQQARLAAMDWPKEFVQAQMDAGKKLSGSLSFQYGEPYLAAKKGSEEKSTLLIWVPIKTTLNGKIRNDDSAFRFNASCERQIGQ